MGEYILHGVSTADRFKNRFVKTALLIRGSKKLFSSEKAADEYLEKIRDENFNLRLEENFECNVEKRKFLDTEYAVFEPKGEKSATTVFYLHGGAYVRHITKLHLKMLDRLCKRTKARIVAPCYLTAPKYDFHQSAEQLIGIYHKETLKSEKIIISADSCGAAIGVCLLEPISNQGLKMPEKAVFFSPLLSHGLFEKKEFESDPMFGGTKGLARFAESWSNGSSAADPMKINFSLLPKTYIFTSKGDMLHEVCLDFFKKAEENNADVTLEMWNEMYHVFALYPLSASKEVFETAVGLIIG